MTTPLNELLPCCSDCGLPYEEFGLDATLPLSQWRELTPDSAPLLCANCICKRASKMPHAVAIRMVVEVYYKSKSVDELPKLSDLKGIAPNAMGEFSSEQFPKCGWRDEWNHDVYKQDVESAGDSTS